MREERLLERIRQWEKPHERRASEDPNRIIASVLRHLEKVLNTRQGSVQIADDYGLPEISEILHTVSNKGKTESIADFERNISKMIQKFEPRLDSVRIDFISEEESQLDPDPTKLHFNIVARIVGRDQKYPVHFRSILNADGKLMIKR